MGKAMEKLWQALGWLDNLFFWFPGAKSPEIGIFIMSIINSLLGMSPWNAGIMALVFYWLYKKLFQKSLEPAKESLKGQQLLELKKLEIAETQKKRKDNQKFTLELVGIVAAVVGLLLLVTCGIEMSS